MELEQLVTILGIIYLLGIRATGRTFREDPITISRSHLSLSIVICLWKASGKLSPKKTMSGFITAASSSGEHLGQWGITCTCTMHLPLS